MKTPSASFDRVYKNNLTFDSDLFKLEVATMKKNVSFVKGQPRIEDIDHCHHYHSRDSQGRVQKYSNKVGGHFHEIITTVDKKTGKPTVVCGPAIREHIKKIRPGKVKKVNVPVSYQNEDTDIDIVDNHTHEITYRGSDKLSQAKIRSQQAADFEKLQNLQGNITKTADIIESDITE